LTAPWFAGNLAILSNHHHGNAMTLTYDTEPDTSQPITDLAAWAAAQPSGWRASARRYAELLSGAASTAEPDPEDADDFTRRVLGIRTGQLAVEQRDLGPAAAIGTALALGEWISRQSAVVEIGPCWDTDPPAWTETDFGDERLRHPLMLRAYFPAGVLMDDAPAVVGIDTRGAYGRPPEARAIVRPEHRDGARAVLDRLAARADQLNPFRGRALRATDAQGLALTVIDLPSTLNRDTVIVPESVWREVDLGVTAVRDKHALLNANGLGSRRGILLVGPPGTGKSAISAVIAAELVGDFTVIYVEATAGARLLTAIVEEAQRGLTPALLVLEDLDLWVRDRASGGGGLSELLQAMDIQSDARILTLASTNDASTLDRAAIRTGRFDSIVEVGYPERAAAGRILTALVDGLAGGPDVDTAAVAAALPDRTSGSDLREIVRRAVLSGDGTVSTAALLTEVGAGRYRAEVPCGTYL
jgi:hypothetical protein